MGSSLITYTKGSKGNKVKAEWASTNYLVISTYLSPSQWTVARVKHDGKMSDHQGVESQIHKLETKIKSEGLLH